MTNSRIISKDFQVAILATIALVILYVGSFFLKGRQVFKSSRTYHVTYTTSKDLKISNPVLINGVTVGKVVSLKILPKESYSVLVTFETDRGIKLTDTSTAKIVDPNLLGIGSKAIEIDVKEGAPLKYGSTIKGIESQGIADVLSQKIMPGLNTLQEPTALTQDLQKRLAKNLERVDKTFAHLEDTMRRMNKMVRNNSEQINTIMHSLAETSEALAHKKEGIKPVLKNIHSITQEINGPELKAIVQKLNKTLQHIDNMLDTSQTTDNLHKKVQKSLENLNQLIIDVKKNPRRYIRFSIF